MTTKDTCTPKDRTNIFDANHKIVLGNKVYLVKRHFIGSRDYVQAVFTAVENEAKRDDSIIQAG